MATNDANIARWVCRCSGSHGIFLSGSFHDLVPKRVLVYFAMPEHFDWRLRNGFEHFALKASLNHFVGTEELRPGLFQDEGPIVASLLIRKIRHSSRWACWHHVVHSHGGRLSIEHPLCGVNWVRTL